VAGELLQISADEQRRAGRSAALFSEEELTRFLQVMLRTFDELGYRQEQRFHFELGLLKLVHLRRLLPIEQVLSQFPVAGGSGQARLGAKAVVAAVAAPTRSSSEAATAARALEASTPIVNAKPAFSPFEKDQSRKRFEERGGEAAPLAVPLATPRDVIVPAAVAVPAEMVLTSGDAIGAERQKVGDRGDVSLAALEVDASSGEEALAAEIDGLQPSSLHSAETFQRAATDALSGVKNQDTAADALADAEWTVADGEVRVQTELSKTMLPMVINADAEKIVKAALRDVGAGALKLMLLPGVKTAAVKKPRAAKSGSAQAKAMEHPIVQRAQSLFNAEVRTVIDLRDGD
jgi:DNA polymerase-3 subunit gamma/tau